MMDIKEINECGNEITAFYDDLIEYSGYYNLLGAGTHTVNGKKIVIDLYELKKKLWICLASVNILEGIVSENVHVMIKKNNGLITCSKMVQ